MKKRESEHTAMKTYQFTKEGSTEEEKKKGKTKQPENN